MKNVTKKRRWSSSSGNSGRRRRNQGRDPYFLPSNKKKTGHQSPPDQSEAVRNQPNAPADKEKVLAPSNFVNDHGMEWGHDSEELKDDYGVERALDSEEFDYDPEAQEEDDIGGTDDLVVDVDMSTREDAYHDSDDSCSLEEVAGDPSISGFPLRWESITSLIMNTGTTRFSEQNYGVFCLFAKWLKRDARLPSSRTVRRVLRPIAKQVAFVRTITLNLPVDFTKCGAKSGVGKFQSATTSPVTIVKPSDWAKMDVSTPYLEGLIRGTPSGPAFSGTEDNMPGTSQPLFSTIEDAPIVQNREHLLHGIRLYSDDQVLFFLKNGAHVQIKLKYTSDLLSACQASGVEANRVGTSEAIMVVEVKSYFIDDVDRRGSPGRLLRVGDIVVGVMPLSVERVRKHQANFRVFLVFRALTSVENRNDYRVRLFFTDKSVDLEHELSDSKDTRQFPVLRICGQGSAEVVEESALAHRQVPKPYGKLADGRSYIIYRFLLYSDGFSPQAFKKGSMGGCYLLPLGICPGLRTSTCVRKVGLTPPGVSTNHILQEIIEDIVQGTVNGVQSKDSCGKDIVIFLDCLGFIGDYPAISETLDVLGHNANAPCHLCFFTKYDRSGRGQGAYSYSTNVHSSHPSFSRFEDRLQVLRQSGIDFNQLGMKAPREGQESPGPLHLLSKRLEDTRSRVPRTAEGLRVVPAIFEPYKSCIIAPDHLFLGLARDAISCVLKHAPIQVRRDAQWLCKQALQENSLCYQKELISPEKMEALSMSISGMYAFLLVAPRAFQSSWDVHRGCLSRGSTEQIMTKSLDLLRCLQTLVAQTQFTPIATVDGLKCVREYNENGGSDRLLMLRSRAMDYVNKVSALCCMSAKAREALDKPNIHRLLEFFTFTLPSFGSVRLIQELVLEKGHQELKRAYSKSNFHNAQIQAMEHAVANDWATRLSSEVQDVRNDGAGWTDGSYRAVLRLLGHPEAQESTLSTAIMQRTRESFPPALLGMLRSRRRSLHLLCAPYFWEACHDRGSVICKNGAATFSRHTWEETCCTDKIITQRFEQVLQASSFLRAMAASDLRMRGGGSVTISIHRRAIMKKGSVHKGDWVEKKAQLNIGDVVQSLSATAMQEMQEMQEDSQIHFEDVPDDLETCKLAYWVVVAIYQAQVQDLATNITKESHEQWKDPFVLVLPCIVGEDFSVTVPAATLATSLLRLQGNVRRVMVIHKCDTDCSISSSAVIHRKTLHDGGRYELFGRFQGYPSRVA